DRRFLGHLFSPRSFLSLPVHSTIGGGGHTLPRSLSAPPCTRCTWQNMIQHCLSGALKSVFRTKRNALKRLSCFCFMLRASHLSFCPALDIRFGWSKTPWYVPVFGDALVPVSFYIFYHCCPANKRIDSIGYLFAQYRIWDR